MSTRPNTENVPHDDPSRRPVARTGDEQRAGDLLLAAMEDVSELVAAVVERDPTGRWFATVADRRLRSGDDLHLVEPLLRSLMPAVTRVADLLNTTTDLHFGRATYPIDWDRLEADPEPWTTPLTQWPSMTHGGDEEPDHINRDHPAN